MIKVLDVNNKNNTTIFEDNEEALAIGYMDSLAGKQNNNGCTLILSKNGKVQSFIIN